MKQYLLMTILAIAATGMTAEQVAQASAPDPQIAALEARVEKMIVENKDFTAALNEYAAAAKANPQAVYYREQYALLQRVIKTNKLLEKETNPEKWKSYAKAVRAYYYSKGYYGEALPLDGAAADKFPTSEYLVNRLETLLLAGRNDEAAKLIGDTKPADAVLRYQTLSPVALAHTGKANDAVKAIADIQVSPKTDAMSYFDFARVYWVAGNKEKAFASLKTLLEHTAPSETPVVQAMICRSPEFSPLKDSKELADVLATPSIISQSGCTGGSSCGSCSLKSKCASSDK